MNRPVFAPRVWLPIMQIGANVAGAIVLMQAIISGVFPWSHHWFFPVMEAALLLQVLATRGRGWALAACSLFVLLVAIARIETIHLSHHLIHFALTFGLAAGVHGRVARASAPGAWRSANRGWAAAFVGVALLAAVIAIRQGVWWGLRDGT